MVTGMRASGLACAVFVLAWSSQAATGQTTWYVDDDACPAVGAGTQAEPFCSIRNAAQAAWHGDTILVSPGYYRETIDIFDKSIVLRSTQGADVTTIDGTGISWPAIACSGSPELPVTIQGFTVVGGSGAIHDHSRVGGGLYLADGNYTLADMTVRGNTAVYGGGAWISHSTVTMTNCRFEANHASKTGSAVYSVDSRTIMTGCTIENNEGVDGGAVACLSDTMVIANSTFRHNAAIGRGPGDDTYGVGAALYNTGCTVEIEGSIFEFNEAENLGGAVFSSYGEVIARDSRFAGNAGSRGGALYGENGHTVLSDCTFNGNVAASGGAVSTIDHDLVAERCVMRGNAALAGGGSNNRRTTSAFTRCTFEGNIASSGSGVYHRDGSCTITGCVFLGNIYDGSGGGIYGTLTDFIIKDSAFMDNEGRGGDAFRTLGGGVYIQGSADFSQTRSVQIDSCTFSGNSASNYGGGAVLGADATVSNSSFVRNRSKRAAGLWNLARVVIWNSVYAFNEFDEGEAAIQNVNKLELTNCTLMHQGLDLRGQLSPTQVQVVNCILRGGLGGSPVGPDVSFSNVLGGAGGWGNIDADPLFADPEQDDFRLRAESPCIDAGDNGAVREVKTDRDGLSRIMNDVVDMGAYEFQGARPVEVRIDVRPGNDVDPLKIGSRGVLPIAILSSASFDALTVDPSTVLVAGAGVALRGNGRHYLTVERDVDHDGLVDLVVHVETAGVEVETTSAKIVLAGQTYDGVPFFGVDAVTTVGR